jgi:hypothetical protein
VVSPPTPTEMVYGTGDPAITIFPPARMFFTPKSFAVFQSVEAPVMVVEPRVAVIVPVE